MPWWFRKVKMGNGKKYRIVIEAHRRRKAKKKMEGVIGALIGQYELGPLYGSYTTRERAETDNPSD